MELREFLKSKIHKKIIAFFHENPASLDTPRGIAAWTNEAHSKVETALKDLCSSGILDSHESTSTTAYSYTRDEKVISRIDKLLKEAA